MRISEQDLQTELDRFGEHRTTIVAELAHNGAPDGIGPALLLALGSRETNIHNIVGDGGHGRGWLQIDDRFHGLWLKTHPGIPSGSWGPPKNGATALAAGFVPTLTHSTLKAIDLLQAAMSVAAANGVARERRLRFAVAAYNAGPGGALRGAARGRRRCVHHGPGLLGRRAGAPQRRQGLPHEPRAVGLVVSLQARSRAWSMTSGGLRAGDAVAAAEDEERDAVDAELRGRALVRADRVGVAVAVEHRARLVGVEAGLGGEPQRAPRGRRSPRPR